MKVFLLGGSNSVVKGGLNSGWPEYVNLINLAIGASSSLQNLSALLEVRDQISSSDLIVTESNVNDSFSIGVYGNDFSEVIIDNIDAFYFELNKVDCNKVVILMPFRNYLGRQESQDIVSLVNERHKFNASYYGFNVVDVDSVFSEIEPCSLKYLMADARHPLQAIMNILANNIAEEFKSKSFFRKINTNVEADEIHFLLNAYQSESLVCSEKKNSIFSSVVGEIKNEIKLPSFFQGLRLVGIGTWSDEQSCIMIRNKDKTFYKKFNSLNSFNEFVTPIFIDEETYLNSYFDDVRVSEKTVNCSNLKAVAAVKLTKLLFRRENVRFIFQNINLSYVDCSYLLPNLTPFIATIRFYLERNEEYFLDHGISVDDIVCEALTLQTSNPKSAKFLLELAYKIRPSKRLKKSIESLVSLDNQKDREDYLNE